MQSEKVCRTNLNSLTAKRAAGFACKYFYISNGKGLNNIGNPGCNASVFYTNYSFPFR